MNREIFELNAQLEDKHWWFCGRRRIVMRVVERALPKSRDTLVIDVGCGTGANVAALVESYSCVGIDSSEVAVALARERFPAVRFIHGLASNVLAGLNCRVGIFLLLDVLEHVRDDFALFSEIAAACHPGTLILVTVPADASLWSQHDISHGHYRRYSRGRLEKLWQGLPIRVRLLTHFNSRLYPVVKLARALGRVRGKASGRAGTDLSMPPGSMNSLLERVFAGEANRLVGLLDGRRMRGYRKGVSLMALVERLQGAIEPRPRPDDVPADTYEPIGNELGAAVRADG